MSGDAGAKIDARIAEFDDWRGEVLARVRAVIKAADPDVVEEWKWEKPSNPGVPVWSHDGIICTGEVYKDKVKLTFMHGAELADPRGIFNSGLSGARRVLDLFEGDTLDDAGLTAVVEFAVERNTAKKKK